MDLRAFGISGQGADRLAEIYRLAKQGETDRLRAMFEQKEKADLVAATHQEALRLAEQRDASANTASLLHCKSELTDLSQNLNSAGSFADLTPVAQLADAASSAMRVDHPSYGKSYVEFYEDR